MDTRTEDLYEILGVPKTATEKQIGAAYKNLALKYHPDRNPNDEEAARNFKAVGSAYAVLIDPAKRLAYDSGGVQQPSSASPLTSDLISLGGISRVFGSVISRFGNSDLNPLVLDNARSICNSGDMSTQEGGPLVGEVIWGRPAEDKVDRHAMSFFKLEVSEENAQRGFAISVKSQNKDKFSVIVFASSGSIVAQGRSEKTRDGKATKACLYFTGFDTYRLSEAPSPAASSGEEKAQPALPALFTRLDTLDRTNTLLQSGRYLLGIYGENFIGKSSFSCLVIPTRADAPQVAEIIARDSSLVEAKQQLAVLKEEYLETKAAYEATLSKMQILGEQIETTLDQQELAYKSFMRAAVEENIRSHPLASVGDGAAAGGTEAEVTDDGHRKQPNLVDNLVPGALAASALGSLDSAVTAASTVSATAAAKAHSVGASAAATASSVGASAAATASSAATTATAAGGWFAKKLTTSMSILQTTVSQHSSSSSQNSSQPPGQEHGQGSGSGSGSGSRTEVV